MEHYAKQLPIAMRTIGREYRYTSPDTAGKPHYSAMVTTSEIIKSDICLRKSDDNS
ncbi:MAG: hypothetical protein Q4D28_09395 [Prevotellaceae bacterium]|nr:hypothetical protein [Prevotellaceae bacterium]